MHLHRQSAYLIGRLRRIADIPVDHPSCSKQHAVFQFRLAAIFRLGRGVHLGSITRFDRVSEDAFLKL